MKTNKQHVHQIKMEKGMKVSELVEEMKKCGVMGSGRIARASDIMQEMIEDKNCTVFMGVAGAMVPGGMKNIIIDLLENNSINVFVTTGATLTHDIAEALGYSHIQGTSNVDDKILFKQGLDRMYDSYMQNEVYGGMEDFFKKIFEEIPDELNIREFLREVGKRIPKENKSILGTCYEKNIPLFCPALADSGIGLMILGHLAKGKKIRIDAMEDMKEMLKIAWDSKKAGVIYIGGGVPKNFIQQAMQFSPKSAEYGVQITTDRPEYGGSSGAELREGISWGKMSSQGKFVDVYCDATIALPIICAVLKDKLE